MGESTDDKSARELVAQRVIAQQARVKTEGWRRDVYSMCILQPPLTDYGDADRTGRGR